jgi:hypothetical protein
VFGSAVAGGRVRATASHLRPKSISITLLKNIFPSDYFQKTSFYNS